MYSPFYTVTALRGRIVSLSRSDLHSVSTSPSKGIPDEVNFQPLPPRIKTWRSRPRPPSTSTPSPSVYHMQDNALKVGRNAKDAYKKNPVRAGLVKTSIADFVNSLAPDNIARTADTAIRCQLSTLFRVRELKRRWSITDHETLGVTIPTMSPFGCSWAFKYGEHLDTIHVSIEKSEANQVRCSCYRALPPPKL